MKEEIIMYEDAEELLQAFGLTVGEEDTLLEILVDSVREQLCNLTGRGHVPAGLRRMAAELSAGLYLEQLKDLGLLEGFDPAPAVQSLEEGDTAVTWAVDSSLSEEGRLNRLIDWLTRGRTDEIRRYRVLIWD